MKNILLYGPGVVGKRNELLKIKKTFDTSSVSTLDLKQQSLQDLISQITFQPLFSTGSRLIIVENVPDKFDVKSLPNSQQDLTLIFLAGEPNQSSVLLKSAKEVSFKIISFEGEKELLAFPFLDALIEGKKQCLVELSKLLEEYGGMYTLSMIYYLLRRNLLPPPSSSFMQKKVINQKKKFSIYDFSKMYKVTLEAEFMIKTGILTEKLALFNLTNSLLLFTKEKNLQ